MISIPRHFAEKNPKRESQTISAAVPSAIAAVGEARPTTENGKVGPPRRPREPGTAHPGASDTTGGREAHQGGQPSWQVRPPGCHAHPPRLPSWVASRRAGGVALGPGRPRTRATACLAAEERGAFDASATGAGDTGPAASTARVRDLALRLHDRAARCDDRFLCPEDHRPGWRTGKAWIPRAPAYAAPRLRLQARERGPRYPGDPALPWSSEHPAHGTVYGDVAGSVQRVLAGLIARLQNRRGHLHFVIHGLPARRSIPA